jgi:hypothetical protein
MEMYSKILKGKKIVGYDLGGGTPTKLSIENLQKITDAVNSLLDIEEDTVFSIETTPVIAANEPEKIKAVFDMPGTVICEVILDQSIGTAPHLSSKALPDGGMVSLPMENLAPFLPEDEFKENMFLDQY